MANSSCYCPMPTRRRRVSIAPRLREALLDRMLMDLWPVTFSIGVLTCPIPPASAEQLIHPVPDELMYRAKQMRQGPAGVCLL